MSLTLFTSSPQFSNENRFNGQESSDVKKQNQASGSIAITALEQVKEGSPCAILQRPLAGGGCATPEPKFFQSSVAAVCTGLRAEVNYPTWDNYPKLSSGDKQDLNALWQALSPHQREQFCPQGEWKAGADQTPSQLLALAASMGRVHAAQVLLKSCLPTDIGEQKKAVAECFDLGRIEGGYCLIKMGLPLPTDDKLSKTDSMDRSLAWFAARESDATTITTLIARGIDVDVPDKNGWTPLLVASNGGQLDAVKALAMGEVNVGAMDVAGWMPVHRACLHGHAEVALTLLLEMGTSPDVPDHLNRTPLHRAVERNRIEVVDILCKNCQVNPDIAGHVDGYSKPISARDLAIDRKQSEICAIIESYSPAPKTL